MLLVGTLVLDQKLPFQKSKGVAVYKYHTVWDFKLKSLKKKNTTLVHILCGFALRLVTVLLITYSHLPFAERSCLLCTGGLALLQPDG